MKKTDKINYYKFPDKHGRFGKFGGRFVAETLMPLLLDVEKKYKEALHYANQALDFNSKNVIALCYRFLALKTLGKNEQASQALKALKQVDPLHRPPYPAVWKSLMRKATGPNFAPSNRRGAAPPPRPVPP